MEIRNMGIRKDNYIKEIEWHTQSYFDDKTSGADITERAEDAIQERIETLIADINAPIIVGNSLPLSNMPLGIQVHNIQEQPSMWS